MKKNLLRKAWSFLLFIAIGTTSVYGQCEAIFAFQPDSLDHKKINFQSNSSYQGNIVSFEWKFGNIGAESATLYPEFIFPNDGEYEVCLMIETDGGCADTVCQMIHIGQQQQQPCKAEFNGEPNAANHLEIMMFSTASGNSPIQTYEWFVDGQSIGINQNMEHVFPQDGEYNICHAIETEAGCRDTVCETAHIGQQNNNDCQPSFDYSVKDLGTGVYEVTFSDSSWSSAGITSWNWAFGDGASSPEQNTLHNYTSVGTYEVCLDIVSADGCQKSYCTEINIGGNQGGGQCYADFNDFQGQGQYEQGFEDRSQAPNGIGSLMWDFGDGTTSSESNTNHVYQNAGEYTVCLVIEGPQCADTLCRQVQVEGNQNNNGCQPSYYSVQDTNDAKVFSFVDNTQLSDGSITSWEWDFGDGNISTEQNPTHVYNDEGMFTACLKITTDKGCEEMHCDFVSIGHVGCHAEFGWDPTGVDKEYKFSNYSFSDTTVSYAWLIEGTSYNEESPTHAFSDTGVFNVELMIFNVTGCSDTLVKQVHVDGHDNQQQGGCQANFQPSQNSGDGSSWEFFDNSFADSGIKTWSWTTGDGYSYDDQNPIHAYSNDGNYTVCLSIEANDGCTDTICNPITIQIDTTNHNNGGGDDNLVPIQGCLASIWAEKAAANPNEFMFTSGSASATGATLNYEWDIEGTSYTSAEVSHSFNSGGEKYARLTVTGEGCTSVAELKVKAGQSEGCGVSFTYVIDSMNHNRAQFALSGTNNLDGGFWQFGDGKQAEEKDPIHHFPGAGFYDVCVTAFDSASGCQTQYCMPIQIEGDDNNQQGGNCFAQFEYQSNGNGEIVFNNMSQGDFTNVHYTFGDGAVADETNPTHVFTNSGVYDVCLNVFDSVSGCVADYCMPITVLLDTADVYCHADFDFFPTGENKFKFANHSQGNFTEAKWEFNGGTNAIKDWEVEYEFDGPGHHEVCLTVFDSTSGCFNTMCKYVEIVDTNVTTCRAEFSFFKDASGEVRFNNESAGAFTNAHWGLGDGMFSDDHNFGHIYDAPGHYEVCLSIFDTISGCQDMICKMVAIEPDSNSTDFCQAKFDGFVDDNGIAHANNMSTGSFTNSHWDFGDGYQAYDMSPQHEFATSGFYTICLNIFDSVSGCQSSHCEEVNIQLDSADVNCFADFNFIIIDGEVKAENISVGNYTHSKWRFGDGGYADGNEVSHLYNATGVYDICLDIWDSISGCQASVCKPITIQKDTQDVYCGAKMEFMHLDKGKVEFMNRSFGSFTNVHWALGNGDFREGHDFAYDFEPGHYEVCLAIMDTVSGCQDQICEVVVIAPDTAEVFCQAKMDGFIDDQGIAHASNQSVGMYTHSNWDFGDGTQSFDHNPSHAFEKSGYYYICLNIYDSVSGCQSSVCEEVDIQLDSADVNCSADFDFMVIDGEVTVKNTSIGTNTNAHWAFGDGGYADGPTANHYYGATGVYDICLAVWDSASGCQAHICKPVTIVKDTQDVFCEAKFDYIHLANGEIKFKDASVGSHTHIHWDLGNGIFADHMDPIANYSSAGVYPVSIMIWDSISGCQSSYTEEIVINGNTNTPECHAKFDFFPIDDKTVGFKNASTGDFTNVRWEFGDGSFAEDENQVDHAFPHGGFFNVCVGIYDSITGCHDYVCDNVELLIDTNIVDCHAEFEFFPTTVTEVAFNNISAGTFTHSFWKFSDGSTSYDVNPMMDFNGTGLFGACLTVFDSVSGCQDEFCVEVPIIDDTTTYCDAHFGYFVDGRTVKFEPEIKGDITGWVWDYNDGFNSNDSFPSHDFLNDGVYEVCLTVFDSTSGCFNTYCEQISIISDVNQVDEYVHADFSYFLDPTDGKVHFKDESVGSPDTWYWNFGDGDSAGVSQDPAYAYTEDGFYEVCLTVKNANGGQETKCEVISVGDVSDACYAKFNYYANAVTATAHFDNKSLGNITGYEWDFGDSLSSIQFQPSHTYADTGFYPVCLTVTNDSGCVKTFCNEIRVGNALENKCLIGCVWPGDANLDLEANHYDILPIGLHYGETGPAREEVSSDWRGHESQDWSKQLWGDVNNKHGDANGDGIIDLDDIYIVEQNFAYSHPWQPRATESNQLSIDWDVDDIDVGEVATLIVSIPDSVNVTMYGVGFEIDLDPTVFDYNTITYDFSNSFLGTENSDLITFGFEDENLGEIYVAESRNDHEELTGNGELVRIHVTATANSSNTGAVLTTEGGVTAEGDTVEFAGAEDAADVNSIEERTGYTIKDLVVFPNPTHGDVSYSLPIGLNSDYVIEVFNNVGAEVYSTSQSGGGVVVTSFDEFNSGIYTLQVTHEKVKYLQKVIVTK